MHVYKYVYIYVYLHRHSILYIMFPWSSLPHSSRILQFCWDVMYHWQLNQNSHVRNRLVESTAFPSSGSIFCVSIVTGLKGEPDGRSAWNLGTDETMIMDTVSKPPQCYPQLLLQSYGWLVLNSPNSKGSEVHFGVTAQFIENQRNHGKIVSQTEKYWKIML